MDNKNNDNNDNNEIKKIKVIFCLPGAEYSGKFLSNWSNLLLWCFNNNFDVKISQKYNSMVHFARSNCLCGDNRRGAKQLPFNGNIDYDYIMWIDSDIIFTVNDFIKLINNDKDVVCGLYKMAGGQKYAVVEKWDLDYWEKHGAFEFLDDKILEQKRNNNELIDNKLLKVHYSGLGWMLIKKGVIEKIEYPWFDSQLLKHKNYIDICSEDVSFCKKIKNAGFDIYLDTTIRVGHYKLCVI